VDGKFCFEGGSRCGPRGEGLHVLGCGQASEIQQALQLASQGKLATRRRPIARKMSGAPNYILSKIIRYHYIKVQAI
jgi:hypothetical protein